jgi:hypothetical protein
MDLRIRPSEGFSNRSPAPATLGTLTKTVGSICRVGLQPGRFRNSRCRLLTALRADLKVGAAFKVGHYQEGGELGFSPRRFKIQGEVNTSYVQGQSG